MTFDPTDDRQYRADEWRAEDNQLAVGLWLGVATFIGWFFTLRLFGPDGFGLWVVGAIGLPIVAFWIGGVFCRWRADRISRRPAPRGRRG